MLETLNEVYNNYIVFTYIINAIKGWLSFFVNCISTLFLAMMCLIYPYALSKLDIFGDFLNGDDKQLICLSVVIICVYQISFHIQRFASLIVDSSLAFDTWSIVEDFQNNIKEEAGSEVTDDVIITDACVDVEFMHVNISIGNNGQILEDLNFIVEAKEKMGIMGVSNLEKKAIISALFRLNEVDRGTMMIGKRNLYEIPLQQLRSMVSIIPIESYLFCESIMNILNPNYTYQLEQIIRNLKLFELYERISMLPKGLATSVEFLTLDEKQVLLLIAAYTQQKPVVVIEGFNFNSLMDKVLRKNLAENFPTTLFIIFANDIKCFYACSRITFFQHGKIVRVDPVTKKNKKKMVILDQ